MLPLLEMAEDGSYVTDIVPVAGATAPDARAAHVALKLPHGLRLHALLSERLEEALVGSAVEIERHWLATTLAPYWRTYVRVMVAALFLGKSSRARLAALHRERL